MSVQVAVGAEGDPPQFLARITARSIDSSLVFIQIPDAFATVVEEQSDVSIGQDSDAFGRANMAVPRVMATSHVNPRGKKSKTARSAETGFPLSIT